MSYEKSPIWLTKYKLRLFLVDFNGFSSARKAKHARHLVVTLMNKENLRQTEFTCEILEEVDEWYQALLNIIQRERSLEKAVRIFVFHKRCHTNSHSCSVIVLDYEI